MWDNGRLQAELDATNNIVEWYLWGLDLSGTMDGAGGVGGLLGQKHFGFGPGGSFLQFYFLAADGQGNVTAAIKYNSGGVEGRFDYVPFGEPLRATGPAAHDEPYTPTIARVVP